MEHVEAGLVRGKPRARLFHSTEGPHGDPTIRFAAPRTAPMLQPHQLQGNLYNEDLYRVLVAQPIATRNGVVSVVVQTVFRKMDASSAAFGRDGVAVHRVHL